MPKPCLLLFENWAASIFLLGFSRLSVGGQKEPTLGPFIALSSDVLLHFFVLSPAWSIGNRKPPSERMKSLSYW